MAPYHATYFVLVCSNFFSTEANPAIFLGSRSQHYSAGSHLHAGAVSDLLHELETVVGRDQRVATQQRVERLEGALRPMFQAVPKNSGNKVGLDGTRFLLHRLFVQRHGWIVNGLDAAGDAWNSSSPTDIFKQHGGQQLHSFFQNKVDADGFDLHHIAVLAATFESLVHAENIERLRSAYRVLGYSESEGVLTDEEADKVVRAYMIMYVLGHDHTSITQELFQEHSATITEMYPTWPDTQIFANEVRQAVLSETVGKERTSWESTLQVLEQIGERYGRWQDKECRVLKKQLQSMEMPGSGRVPLDKFYSGGMDDENWMFLESVPYLEQLGALDKSNPAHLSVVIPNYINSPTNCVASSKFYSVCCVDECEALVGTLEERIGSWQSTPEIITQLVSGLASDTIAAPRQLPNSLVQRLSDVAAHHNGQVPLHGRLFAQWMHHAFPRECAYPHMSGTTSPAVVNEYERRHGLEALASKEDMRRIIEQSRSETSANRGDIELPWSAHEELFIARPTGHGSSRETANGLLFAGLTGLVCTAVSVHRVFTPSTDSKASAWGKDHFV